MPKDFAGRTQSKGRNKTRKNTRAISPKARVLFHGPSFSFGAIVGAALIIVAAYAPDWLAAGNPAMQATQAEVDNTPEVIFEFQKILKESEVLADPAAYPVPEQNADAPPKIFQIQAASFTTERDANGLRARLLLKNLPASVDSSTVDNQLWYRVKVGPFANKTLADRAMTVMREMYLTPIWMN